MTDTTTTVDKFYFLEFRRIDKGVVVSPENKEVTKAKTIERLDAVFGIDGYEIVSFRDATDEEAQHFVDTNEEYQESLQSQEKTYH